MTTNTDNSLTTDHLSNFRDLLVSVGYSHARQWLQSERELALPDDEIERQYDRWRDDNLPVPQWYDLTEKTKDELRDVYLDSFREGAYWPAPVSSDKELLREAIGALEYISNPLKAMQEEAHRAGCRLDGQFAYQLATDHNYLKSVADKTLKKLQSATR